MGALLTEDHALLQLAGHAGVVIEQRHIARAGDVVDVRVGALVRGHQVRHGAVGRRGRQVRAW